MSPSRLLLLVFAVLVALAVAGKTGKGSKGGKGGDSDDDDDRDDDRDRSGGRRRSPQPRPPRGDLMRTIGDLMSECMKGRRSKEEKKLCREEAREQFDNITDDDDDMDRSRREAYFEKYQRDAGKKKAKGKIETCLTGSGRRSRSQVMACMAQAKNELKDDLDSYMQGRGQSAQKVEKRRKQLEKEATREVLGKLYGDCIKAAGGGRASKRQKKQCKEILKSGKQGSGLDDEDEDSIARRFFEAVLMRPAEECTSTPKECRRAAKREAMENGMSRREYVAVKRMGEIKAAAAIWASCVESGENASVCEDVTREEFMRVSGARGEDFAGELLQRVRSLGEALNNGEPLVLVKFMSIVVSAVMDGLECNNTIEEIFAVKALWVARRIHAFVRGAVKRRCRLVDDAPEYGVTIELNESANLTDEEMDNFSVETSVNLGPVMNDTADNISDVGGGYILTPEEVAALLGQVSRRLLEEDEEDESDTVYWASETNEAGAGRRLDQLTEDIYGSHFIRECAKDDGICAAPSLTSGGTSPTSSPTSGPTPTPAPPPSPTPTPPPSPSQTPTPRPPTVVSGALSLTPAAMLFWSGIGCTVVAAHGL